MNHLKSKGCGGATGADMDQGDGQGCWNPARREAAIEMGFDRQSVETVWGRLSSTHWKRELPTVALLSDHAIGESYLRPVDY